MFQRQFCGISPALRVAANRTCKQKQTALQTWSFILLFKFSAGWQYCASKSATSYTREPLPTSFLIGQAQRVWVVTVFQQLQAIMIGR